MIYTSSSHCNQQRDRIKEFYSNNQLCDVSIICGERRIPAHRVILAGACDYFAAMFTGAMNEAEQREVSLHGIESDALCRLIRYCYTGEIELQETSVEALLSGASLLQLSDVVHACSSFLVQQLHASNCLGIRAFADAQGCQSLQEDAQQFTLHNFSEVSSHHEFLLLPVDDLKSLLLSDDLCVPNEEAVFKAFMAWLGHDVPNRRRHSAMLLQCIRLPLLKPEFISDHVENCPLLRDDRLCQDLILEALKFHLLPSRRETLKSSRTRPRKSTVGYLYSIGGQDSNKCAMTIERYDYLGDSWSVVGHMSSRRLQAGFAIVENDICVVGGRDGLKTLNSFEKWVPETDTWRQLEPMHVPRHGLGVAVLEGPLYVVGGHDGWSYLNTVERYDPQTKHWTKVAEMSTSRSTLGVAVLNGRIYAVGGRDGNQCLRTVESYNPHTNRWSQCSSMCKRRGGVGVTVYDGFIYAVGGMDAPSCNPACTRYDCVERYYPLLDQWTIIASLPLGGRDGIGLCAMGDLIFFVGGYNGHSYLNDRFHSLLDHILQIRSIA